MDRKKIAENFLSITERQVIPEYSHLQDSEIRFDTNLLHESKFKEIITYYDSVLNSPLEFIITATLASLSGAVGRNAYLPVMDSLTIYPNIWAVLIGPSTIMKKTTAIDKCTKDLHDLMEIKVKDYKAEYAEFQKMILEVKDPKAKIDLIPPQLERLIYPNDTTVESLADLLSNNSRGLLIHSEFGSLLSQLNRSYNGDSKQFLASIYDVPRIWEVARATKQATIVRRPFLSILAATTIDWMKDNSRPADLRTGFFARYIFSIRNIPDKPFIPLLSLRNLNNSAKLVNTREVFEYLTSIKESIALTISKEAEEGFTVYDLASYNELLNCSTDSEMSFKGRLLIYTLKFAAIIALVDRRTEIQKNDIDDGIVLVEYYKRNVEKLLYTEMAKNESRRKEEKIIELILKFGFNGKINHSRLLQHSNMDVEPFNSLIKGMLEKEWIDVVKEGRGKHYILKKEAIQA